MTTKPESNHKVLPKLEIQEYTVHGKIVIGSNTEEYAYFPDVETARLFLRAVNAYDKNQETIAVLVSNLRATTVGFHELSSHAGTVDKCGWDNCRWANEAIAQAEATS